MGDRYTPTTLAWGNTTTFVNETNLNFQQISDLLDTFLSRTDDTNANAMSVDLDMNSQDINNVGAIRVDQLFVDGAQVPSLADIQAAFAAGQTAIDASVTAAQTAETNAETAQTAAEAAQAAAEAAAAGVSLPSIVGGDAGKQLYVKSDETGYELDFANTVTTATAGTGGDFATLADAVDYFREQGRTGQMVTITVLDLAAVQGTTLVGVNGWLTLTTNGVVLSGTFAGNVLTIEDSTVWIDDFHVSADCNYALITRSSKINFKSTCAFTNTSVTTVNVFRTERSELVIPDLVNVSFIGKKDDTSYAVEVFDASVIRMAGQAGTNVIVSGRVLVQDYSKIIGGSIECTVNLPSSDAMILQLGADVDVYVLEIINENAAATPNESVSLSMSTLKTFQYQDRHPNATLNVAYVSVVATIDSVMKFRTQLLVEDSLGTFVPTYHVTVNVNYTSYLSTGSLTTVLAGLSTGPALTKNSFNSGNCIWVSK